MQGEASHLNAYIRALQASIPVDILKEPSNLHHSVAQPTNTHTMKFTLPAFLLVLLPLALAQTEDAEPRGTTIYRRGATFYKEAEAPAVTARGT